LTFVIRAESKVRFRFERREQLRSNWEICRLVNIKRPACWLGLCTEHLE